MANQNPPSDLHLPFVPSSLFSPMFDDQKASVKCMLPTNMLEEQPLLVNPRRYERIIKRRIARDKQGPAPRPPSERTYQHEFRHKHACNRKRGPNGIFLPKTIEPEAAPKKKVKYSRYSAACVLYGMPPDD